MIKSLLPACALLISLSSHAMVKPNVDAFIVERENFTCEKNVEAKKAFDNVIREQFQAESQLYANTLLLKSLEELIEDQETLAQIQTALVIGPTAGILAVGSTYGAVSLPAIAALLGTPMEASLGYAGVLGTVSLFGATGTYAVSDDIVDVAMDVFGEEHVTDELLATIKTIGTVNVTIEKVRSQLPELVRNGKYEKIVDQYVGWSNYMRYNDIVDGLVAENKLLRLKSELVKSVKQNLRISCN